MKLFVKTALTLFVMCGLAFSQAEKPTAAVYIDGRARDRDALRMLVNNFMVRSGKYQVVAANALDVAARRGRIRVGNGAPDADIARLGSAAGVDFICVVKQARHGEGSLISIRLVSVVSRSTVMTSAAELPAGGKIVDVVQGAVEALVTNADAAVRAQAQARQARAAGGMPPEGFVPEIPAIAMIAVQGGTFAMGCTHEQRGECDSDESPVRNVTLSDFSIGKFEITQRQWMQVMGTNPAVNKGDSLPVENVSWLDVQAFITKLNELSGKNYRLPTEAEWEYAARGGNRSGGFRYSGSANVDDVAWYLENSNGKSQPVGTKAPNELGIHDMSGNVEEWIGDWYGQYGERDEVNPTGSASGSNRGYRGGGWKFAGRYTRVSYRDLNAPNVREEVIGFRLVLPSGNPPPAPVTPPRRSGFQGSAPEFEMVAVEGGTFNMGCMPAHESNCESSEKPAHSVTVGNFLIGKFEVTQGQWAMVMGDNPTSSRGDRGDNNPVVDVSYNDVMEFIEQLNRLSGKNYRLPTEAEWEYAARGGNRSGGFVYAGGNDLNEVAWYTDNSRNRVNPVGAKKANELGIHDMSGNAREWVGDWFGEYTGAARTNPKGPQTGTHRILRGGDHLDPENDCRVTSRGTARPNEGTSYHGFRLAIDP